MNTLVARLVGGAARTALSFAAGYLVSKGVISADNANSLVGAMVGIGALLLSGQDKLNTSTMSLVPTEPKPSTTAGVTLSWEEYESMRTALRKYEQGNVSTVYSGETQSRQQTQTTTPIPSFGKPEGYPR